MSSVPEDPATAPSFKLSPYKVWLACRVLATLGLVMVGSWFLWIMAFAWGHVETLPPMWIAIVGTFLSAGKVSYRNSENLPPLCEIIGRALAPKHCATCGQSIFDERPSAGYAPDTMGYSYLPQRQCANCGSDMTKPGAAK